MSLDMFKPDKVLTHEDRVEMLDAEWMNLIMPCGKCEIRDICKHAFTIKRPNFDPAVFNVGVTCRIMNDYRRNRNGQTAEHQA